jgi:diacylglycerol kinase (ATP)
MNQRPAEPKPQTGADLKSRSGLARISKAAIYSFYGFRAALKHEHAFRQELILVAVLTPVALLLPVSALSKLALIAVLLLVLIVELLNSAIEAVVDKASPEIHPLAGRAKDMGSAAVFLSLLLAAATWGVVAGPVLVNWLG